MWRARSKTRYGVILASIIACLVVQHARAADTVISSQICPAFQAPTITVPSDGFQTQDSTVQVAGTADPGAVVDILDNGSDAGSVTTAGDGSFGLSIPLVAGKNLLEAEVVNSCSTTQHSQVVTVTRLVPQSNQNPAAGPTPVVRSLNPHVTPPSPVISSNPVYAPQLQPLPRHVTVPRLWVAGTALPYTIVDVVVNGRIVARVLSSSQGSFGVLVDLIRGDNTIQAQIVTGSQTLTSKAQTVTYAPLTIPKPVVKQPKKPTSVWLVFAIVSAIIVLLSLLGAWLRHKRKPATMA